MANNRALQTAIFGVSSGFFPKRGPKVLLATIQLGAVPTSFDLMSETMQDEIEFVQAVYLDTSTAAGIGTATQALTLTVGITGQRIICPPKSQGIFSLFAPSNPQFTLYGGGYVGSANLIFSNMPLCGIVWAAN